MYPGHWSRIFPNKPAVVNTATGVATTYRELDDRSNQLAQLMWAKGLRPGDHVAIFMENHLRYFEVVWAALRSGLYLTTINRYLTADEAGYILDNCEAKVLVTSSHLADLARTLPPLAPRCSTYLMVDGTIDGFGAYEEAIAAYPAKPLLQQPAGTFMLYSSGTTGRPKGILRPLPGYSIDQDAGRGRHEGVLGFDEHSSTCRRRRSTIRRRSDSPPRRRPSAAP
jgi:fatty-acyl-CoA synthase